MVGFGRQPGLLIPGLASNYVRIQFRSAWQHQGRLIVAILQQRNASTTGKYRPLQQPDKKSLFANESEVEARIRIMRRQTLYIGGGLLVFFGSMWATSSYVRGEPEAPPLQPGEDVSSRYKDIATGFDSSVSSTEFWMGIGWLRKRLIAEAYGHILEVSVGTGRNSKYYKEDQCKSITMIDLSGEMLEIALERFKEDHPTYMSRKFVVQSALDPLASPAGGFDTVIQTMGLCSTPDPVGLLKRIGSVLKPDTGRILLLEHGRGHYDWINNKLDHYAPHHAHKFGCWWNKDIKQIIDESGLEIVKLKRYHFGTTWKVELKSKTKVNASEDEVKTVR